MQIRFGDLVEKLFLSPKTCSNSYFGFTVIIGVFSEQLQEVFSEQYM